jgi:hypothetical protein
MYRLRRSSGNRSKGAPSEVVIRVHAATRLRHLSTQLGADDVRLLEIAVVENAKWCQLARQFGVYPKTARTWGIAAIRRLGLVR